MTFKNICNNFDKKEEKIFFKLPNRFSSNSLTKILYNLVIQLFTHSILYTEKMQKQLADFDYSNKFISLNGLSVVLPRSLCSITEKPITNNIFFG